MKHTGWLLLASLLPLHAYAAAPKPVPVAAMPSMNIAVVVGDAAITSADVESRMRFIMATTRMADTPDVVARIRPQVIRTLIDEQIQMQEAAKNSIKVEEKEIAAAISTIEEQRGMQPGEIQAMMKEYGVREETFLSQIRAQLAWNKLISKKVRPLVKVSDEEATLAKKRFSQPDKVDEVQIAIIAIPLEKKREEEVKRSAEKLVAELRKGANFEEVARQFSVGSEAKVDAFWIQPEQLDPALAAVLKGAPEGTITDPQRTAEGFTIVRLLKTRSTRPDVSGTQVTLKEILLKLKFTTGEKETQTMLAVAEEVAKHPGTCKDETVANIQNTEALDISVEFRTALITDLPQAVQSIAGTLKEGEISSPFASEDGIRLYMLCERKENATPQVDTMQVKDALYRQKFELEVQKYLRNLRRDAFVDVRANRPNS